MLDSQALIDMLFTKSKFVPVVAINDPKQAILAAKALIAGGIYTIEVTLRVPKAIEVIQALSQEVPQILVGAGTVITSQQFNNSIKAGAKFIVSPGLSEELAEIATANQVAFLPGALTPTEIMRAINLGINVLKFFPAIPYNALNVLASLSSVFPQVKFCPTGGISLTNAKQILTLNNVIGVGCSYLIKDEYLTNNDYGQITRLAKQSNDLLK